MKYEKIADGSFLIEPHTSDEAAFLEKLLTKLVGKSEFSGGDGYPASHSLPSDQSPSMAFAAGSRRACHCRQ